MWDLIVSVPDHCLSFYFVANLMTTENLILVHKPEYVRLNPESTFRVF